MVCCGKFCTSKDLEASGVRNQRVWKQQRASRTRISPQQRRGKHLPGGTIH